MYVGIAMLYLLIGGCVSRIVSPHEEDGLIGGLFALVWPCWALLWLGYGAWWLVGKAVGR